MNLIEYLQQYGDVLTDESLAKHTTFRIGGPCDYFVYPKNMLCFLRIMQVLKEQQVPYRIFGKGSNLLCSDDAFHGVILCLDRYLNNFYFEADGTLVAEAGCSIILLAQEAMRRSLSGLEFASGIPGTLGGAVRMNAGAYGGEIRQVLKSADVLTPGGEVLTLPVEEMKMGYRTSIVSKMDYVVLAAELVLRKGDKEKIRAKMDELKEKRVSKQPLEFGSAGSTFKRPEGYFAGRLIEEAGLRGFRVGNAQVSEKHCGFVINRGGATAREVAELMETIVRRVEENSGVRLEPEVKRIGEF